MLQRHNNTHIHSQENQIIRRLTTMHTCHQENPLMVQELCQTLAEWYCVAVADPVTLDPDL